MKYKIFNYRILILGIIAALIAACEANPEPYEIGDFDLDIAKINYDTIWLDELHTNYELQVIDTTFNIAEAFVNDEILFTVVGSFEAVDFWSLWVGDSIHHYDNRYYISKGSQEWTKGDNLETNSATYKYNYASSDSTFVAKNGQNYFEVVLVASNVSADILRKELRKKLTIRERE